MPRMTLDRLVEELDTLDELASEVRSECLDREVWKDAVKAIGFLKRQAITVEAKLIMLRDGGLTLDGGAQGSLFDADELEDDGPPPTTSLPATEPEDDADPSSTWLDSPEYQRFVELLTKAGESGVIVEDAAEAAGVHDEDALAILEVACRHGHARRQGAAYVLIPEAKRANGGGLREVGCPSPAQLLAFVAESKGGASLADMMKQWPDATQSELSKLGADLLTDGSMVAGKKDGSYLVATAPLPPGVSEAMES